VLLRLDGLYGDAAPLLDVLSADLAVVARSRAYHLLDQDVVKLRLLHVPDQVSTHPESCMARSLYDCASVPLTPAGPNVRLIVATHPATGSAPTVGIERDGTVYELFVSTLPSPAFTAADVLDLYLHRGSFETVLADEDDEQESDRWYSHTPCGQEFAQVIAQWVWNLRLELGQALSPSELRTTEFAPACEAEAPSTNEPPPAEALAPAVIYGPPKFARPSFTHGFPGSAFTPQPDGTLRCPANHPLYLQERRPERDGSLRILYAARIGHCRSCSLRAQCQESSTTLSTTTGECGAVAALLFALGCLASSRYDQNIACFRCGTLARLATLRHSADLAQSDPQPNHLPGKLLSALAITRKSAHGEGLDPSGACALASLLEPTPGTQCPSIGRSPTGRRASRTASHLCFRLWL
jgi:hypothetical protein